MELFDVYIKTDSGFIIDSISWNNLELKKLFGVIWEKYINQSINNLFSEFCSSSSNGTITWEDNIFSYSLITPSGDAEKLVLMKQADDKEYLFAKTLDRISEGIQIYDKNACAVYFNTSSRQISEIPDSVNVEGRHLLDMYNLDEDISTTMTTLKTGQPVINRVDHYNSVDGTFIATANTAYPIRKNGHIVGAVVFEQTKKIVDDYISQMEEIDRALKTYKSADSYLAFTGYCFDNVLGKGKAMMEAVRIGRKIAKQDCSVLLVGETGTGKELFAQSIHKESLRNRKKFLAINCAAIPDTLIESLLFGTAKGSFTGSEDKTGYFEEANGGTIFLDELNSMSLSMQSKILRVLQEKTFRRIGGKTELHADVRIISSCNENPFVAIKENRLRKDLFYRLSTVIINLPSLRDHMEDLDTLIWSHIENSNFHFVNKVTRISTEAFKFLRSYSWPGNVRELFHVIDYALNITDSDTIDVKHLPKYLFENGYTSDIYSDDTPEKIPDWNNETLQTIIDTYEEKVIRQALDHFGGNITKTASVLDIRRQSLQYRIKKYGIIV